MEIFKEPPALKVKATTLARLLSKNRWEAQGLLAALVAISVPSSKIPSAAGSGPTNEIGRELYGSSANNDEKQCTRGYLEVGQGEGVL